MGRELKRVPLDFAWPQGKVWPGFLQDSHPCPEEGKTCFAGSTAAGKWIEAVGRLLAMLAEEANAAHPYLQKWPQAPRTELPRAVHDRIHAIDDKALRCHALVDAMSAHPARLLPLTNELAALVEGLAGRKIDGFSGCAASYAIEVALRKAAGVDEKWGVCPVCDGHAEDPAHRAASEAWEPTEPPTGPGYQLWEDTSEGSPDSPVFATLDELCAWCEPNATTFASFRATAAEWKKMLSRGLVSHTEGRMTFL